MTVLPYFTFRMALFKGCQCGVCSEYGPLHSPNVTSYLNLYGLLQTIREWMITSCISIQGA